MKFFFSMKKKFPASVYTGRHFPKNVLGIETITMLLLTKILALNVSINTIASPLRLCKTICSWNNFIHQDIKGPW